MESVNNSGTFFDISCSRLLVQLHLAQFNGTLRISQGALLKLLYFQKGAIAMASSNDQGDHLAPILMRAGKLKSEQLELARKQAQPGTSLARVLVQMGFLTSGELFAGARQQLRQIVGSVLGLTEGHYEIQADFFPREVTSLNVDTRELLLDLITEFPERSLVLLEVGAPDTMYMPTSSPSSSKGPVNLPRRWQDHAATFSRPMTIHAFGQAAGLDDFTASKAVYGLHLFGFLQPLPDEPEAVPVPVDRTPRILEVAGAEAADSVSLRSSAPATAPELPEIVASSSEPEGTVGQSDLRQEFGMVIPQHPVEESPPAELLEGEATFEAQPASPPQRFMEHPASRGEILAQGEPIRLDFRGSLPPPESPSRASGPWGVLSILAGIAILAMAFVWFVFLKGSPAPADVSPASLGKEATTPAIPPAQGNSPVETNPTAPEAAEVPKEEPLPADSAGATGDFQPPPSGTAVGEAPSSPPRAATVEAAAGGNARGTPAEPIPGAGEESTKGAPMTSAPPPEKDSAGTPARESIAKIPPFAAAGRFFEGRSRLDAGDPASAAASWLQMTREESRNGFTIQIAIACQEDSIMKAAGRTRGSVEFFSVPFPLQGKTCYRLCWGAYPTLEEAQAGKASVPDFFLSGGGDLVVVSLKKLAPPENR